MTFLLPSKASYVYSPSDTPNLGPLKQLDQWVVWWGAPKEGGGFRKMAIHPETRCAKGYGYSKPENHLPYLRARAVAEGLIAETGGIYGVSFVPNPSGSVVAIDIDRAFDRETGEVLKPWAIDLAREIGSYTEVSPSGTGLRTIVFGVGDFPIPRPPRSAASTASRAPRAATTADEDKKIEGVYHQGVTRPPEGATAFSEAYPSCVSSQGTNFVKRQFRDIRFLV